MRNVNRRTILADPATLPALTLPVVAAEYSDRELIALDQELGALHPLLMAAFDETVEASEQLKEDAGYAAAQEKADDLNGRAWEIGERIFAIRATTIEGMKIKLRTAERLGIEDVANDPDPHWRSLRLDILNCAAKS